MGSGCGVTWRYLSCSAEDFKHMRGLLYGGGVYKVGPVEKTKSKALFVLEERDGVT